MFKGRVPTAARRGFDVTGLAGNPDGALPPRGALVYKRAKSLQAKSARRAMFDIRWIRDNPDKFDAGLAKRGLEPLAGGIVAMDEARRKHVTALNDMQARRN